MTAAAAVPPPGASRREPDPDHPAVLRESVLARCRQTAPGLGGIALFAALLLTLWKDAAVEYILAWQLPLLAAMTFRYGLARRITSEIDRMPRGGVVRADRALRWSSIVNQTIGGAGVWIIGAHGSPVAMYYVTFAILFFAIGAMVNLSSDFRSFRISLPLLLSQPVLYWLTTGTTGLLMVVTIVVPGLLMLLSVRNSSRIFAESVTIRLEKDALLEQVEAQHGDTQRALAVAEDANRAKIAFLAAASHDLRQPLFAISVLADTLKLHDLPKPAREVLAQQSQAIGVLRTLFDNLLDLSRFEAGGVEPARREIRLFEVFNPLDGEFGPLCRSKGISWECVCPQVSVFTDPELLLRLLGNLLANAVRYTERGGVKLSASVAHERVHIEVEDSGIGIDPANHRRIFEEFVQLGNPHRDRNLGSGLGLSIVQKIDRLLHTGLAMKSAIGEGTRFLLSVPMAATPADAATTANPVPPCDDPTTMRGLNVWVVEDDPLVRAALSAQFDAWKVMHREFESAAILRQALATEPALPDAAILDDMLGPEDSGLELANMLAKRISKDRIILVTGNPDPQRLAQLRASGFTVLAKPVSGEDLRRSLSSTVRGPCQQ